MGRIEGEVDDDDDDESKEDVFLIFGGEPNC
jgi:hypothetical protein